MSILDIFEDKRETVELLARRDAIDNRLEELASNEKNRRDNWKDNAHLKIGPLSNNIHEAKKVLAEKPHYHNAFHPQNPTHVTPGGVIQHEFGISLTFCHPKMPGKQHMSAIYYRDFREETWEETEAKALKFLDNVGKSTARGIYWSAHITTCELAELENLGQLRLDIPAKE